MVKNQNQLPNFLRHLTYIYFESKQNYVFMTLVHNLSPFKINQKWLKINDICSCPWKKNWFVFWFCEEKVNISVFFCFAFSSLWNFSLIFNFYKKIKSTLLCKSNIFEAYCTAYATYLLYEDEKKNYFFLFFFKTYILKLKNNIILCT